MFYSWLVFDQTEIFVSVVEIVFHGSWFFHLFHHLCDRSFYQLLDPKHFEAFKIMSQRQVDIERTNERRGLKIWEAQFGAHLASLLEPVLPDWANFENSRQLFSHKCSQNIWWLFGPFWKTSLLSKNCCCYILDNFWKMLVYLWFQHLVTLFGTHAYPKQASK